MLLFNKKKTLFFCLSTQNGEPEKKNELKEEEKLNQRKANSANVCSNVWNLAERVKYGDGDRAQWTKHRKEINNYFGI